MHFYRDLKVENMLLDSNTDVKIIGKEMEKFTDLLNIMSKWYDHTM